MAVNLRTDQLQHLIGIFQCQSVLILYLVPSSIPTIHLSFQLQCLFHVILLTDIFHTFLLSRNTSRNNNITTLLILQHFLLSCLLPPMTRISLSIMENLIIFRHHLHLPHLSTCHLLHFHRGMIHINSIKMFKTFFPRHRLTIASLLERRHSMLYITIYKCFWFFSLFFSFFFLFLFISPYYFACFDFLVYFILS